MPFILAGIFSVAITVFMVAFIVSSLDTQVQANDIFPAEAKAKSTQMSNGFPEVVDGGMVLLFFLACFVSFAFAALIPVHPVFIVFYIFEWLLVIWLGGGIANAYQMIQDVPILAATKAKFHLTENLFRYLPFAIGVVGAILAVIMYKTKKAFIGE